MNERNINAEMMRYVSMIHTGTDETEIETETEHVIKGGLLRKIIDWLGLEITYKV